MIGNNRSVGRRQSPS